MTLDLTNTGPYGAMRFSGSRSRSVVSDSVGAVRYPSPFFDLGSMYLPNSFKTMLRWCRYYFLTNPIINTVVYKMAEYPVTDLVIDEGNEALQRHWETFYKNTIQLKRNLVEIGLDYGAYGNAFISIHYPFRKYLVCPSCKHAEPVDRQKYTFRDYKFDGECNKCRSSVTFKVKDHYVRSSREIRLIRWNPEYISIYHNEATGESKYYYSVPATLSNDVRMAKRHVIETLPQPFMEAIKENKAILFSPDNLYHMKRPTIAQKDKGWGLPMILPVLKDTFYLAILRKAQEAIAVEHAVPLRILFPQTTSGSADPYSTVNLSDWKKTIEQEIMRWRCISPDSYVETYSGLKKAGDIVVGDHIRSQDGGFNTVTRTGTRPLDESEEAYSINIAGLRAINTVYSEDHPILASKKRNNGNGHKLGESDFIPVSSLTRGDYIGYPISREIIRKDSLDLADFVDNAATSEWVYVDHTETDVPEAFEYLSDHCTDCKRSEILSEKGWSVNSYKVAQIAIRDGRVLRRVKRHIPFDKDLAYVAGIYSAEGNTTPKAVYFSLHKDEVEIVRKLDDFFLSRFGASRTGGDVSNNGIQIAYCSTIAAKFFHGLIPGISRTKELSPTLFNANKELAIEFIRGCLDGDGSIYDSKAVMCSSSMQLSESIRKIILSFGILPGISYVPGKDVTICGKKTRGSGLYVVQVSGNSYRQLKCLFDGVRYSGPTHTKLGLIRDGIAWFRIRGVNKVKADSVVTIGVSGDNTFCTWGVATHNCDNNYIPVLPLPVGQQTLGGDGRALMLSQEYTIWGDNIITGMGVPLEFVKGGLSFSGSSVSLRMLENHFLDQKSDHLHLVNDFITPRVAAFMGWNPVSGHFKKFKMADDLQRSAFNLQLNQAGKISDHSLLEDTDWDSIEELRRITDEKGRTIESQRTQALGQANIQGEAQLAMSKYQMKAQKAMEQMQADPQMLAQQQQEGAGMQQVAGSPEMSPQAMGQMGTAEMGMMNQQGMIPPMDHFREMAMQQQRSEAGQASAMARGGQLQGEQPGPQQEMGSPLQAGQQAGIPLETLVNKIIGWLDQLPINQQQPTLAQMATTNPQLFRVVKQALETRRGAHQSSAAMPAPEQKAPRRGPESTT